MLPPDLLVGFAGLLGVGSAGLAALGADGF